MKSKVTLLLLTALLSFLSCKNNLAEFELVRKHDLELNENAKSSLNEITKLLNGGNALYNSNVDSNSAIIIQYYVYFNLTDSNDKLYIRKILWWDLAQKESPNYVDYEVPINEIDDTNIEVSESSLPIFGGEFAHFSINAKLNNPDAFGVKPSKYIQETDELKVIDNYKKSSITIPLKIGVANKLKKELITLVKNYPPAE